MGPTDLHQLLQSSQPAIVLPVVHNVGLLLKEAVSLLPFSFSISYCGVALGVVVARTIGFFSVGFMVSLVY